MSLLFRLLFLLALASLNSCTEGDPTPLYESLVVELNDVQSINLNSVNTIITTGDSLQLSVTATNSNAEEFDLTDKVSWHVSDNSLASVNGSGLLQSYSTDGSLTVTASLDSLSSSLDITLSSALLTAIEIRADSVTPDQLVTSVCRPINLKAFGTYDDLSVRDISDKVSWQTSNTGAVLNTATDITLSYYQAPSVDVTATFNTISHTATVTVNDDIDSMVLGPASVILQVGETVSYQVLASYGSDTDINISSTTHYSSSDSSRAAFKNNDQVLTALLQGNITVTASCGSVSETASVEVQGKALDRIEISPSLNELLIISANSSYQLNATAYYSDGSDADITNEVSWSATHPKGNVVTVSNTEPNKGLVTSASILDIDIIEISYAGKVDTITVQVQ